MTVSGAIWICTRTYADYIRICAAAVPHCVSALERGGRQACTEVGRQAGVTSGQGGQTVPAKSVHSQSLVVLKTACVVASLHHSEKMVSQHRPLQMSAAVQYRVRAVCVESS